MRPRLRSARGAITALALSGLASVDASAQRLEALWYLWNPGFDQPTIHRVLTDPTARAQALRSLATLCRDNRFDGI